MTYRIAYVDESRQWLNTIHTRLENELFVVEEVEVSEETSLEDIKRLVSEDRCDLLALDYLLSELANVDFNGSDVVEEIRKQYPHFPIVMFTGRQDEAIENTDEVHIVYSKKLFDDENEAQLEILKDKICHHIDSHKNKKEATESRIMELIEKRNSFTGLNAEEESELIKLSRLMDELEPEGSILPNQFQDQAAIIKLDTFVRETQEILAELRSLSQR